MIGFYGSVTFAKLLNMVDSNNTWSVAVCLNFSFESFILIDLAADVSFGNKLKSEFGKSYFRSRGSERWMGPPSKTTHTHTHSHILTLTLSNTHTHTLTHTHTHTYLHKHLVTLTHTHRFLIKTFLQIKK
jgi:hypothetical protein